MPVLWTSFGFYAKQDPAFISMWIQIRIQRAKSVRIHADPDPDPEPGQTLKSKAGNQIYLSILINFLTPGSGSQYGSVSRTAKSMRIRILNTEKMHIKISPFFPL
jgi:hypothetical protein